MARAPLERDLSASVRRPGLRASAIMIAAVMPLPFVPRMEVTADIDGLLVLCRAAAAQGQQVVSPMAGPGCWPKR
ncbi:MAG: hypothetical protein B7Y47_09475 [Sphingomonas sp. 28-63-12]|nr:MAG: hypothetical protein B7Y47_09475 [Sphingomonas sp. 28-63-12]